MTVHDHVIQFPVNIDYSLLVISLIDDHIKLNDNTVVTVLEFLELI